jgi:hypothetical protein
MKVKKHDFKERKKKLVEEILTKNSKIKRIRDKNKSL